MHFEAVFNNALDAMLLADDDQRYIDANPAACELTGYDRDELLQLRVQDLTPDDEQGGASEAFAAFVTAGRAEGTFRLARRDGSVVETEFRAVANVAPGVHLSVLHDVTATVRARRELEASVETLNVLETQRRELIRELLAAREGERRRLARELHDELGQILTSVKLLAVGLQQAPEDRMRTGLGDIHDLAQKAVDATRVLVGHLREGGAEDPTLRASLHRLAYEAESLHGLAVEVSANVDGDLVPVPVATAAHRIASEALNNAVKHAEASVVSIVAMRVEDTLVLVIEDDGMGFDPATASSSGGHGLVGMRERIAELSGTLTIAAAPGKGTTIRAELPLET